MNRLFVPVSLIFGKCPGLAGPVPLGKAVRAVIDGRVRAGPVFLAVFVHGILINRVEQGPGEQFFEVGNGLGQVDGQGILASGFDA